MSDDEMKPDILLAGQAEATFFVQWLDAGNSTGSLSEHAQAGLADSFSRAIVAERERCAKIAEWHFFETNTRDPDEAAQQAAANEVVSYIAKAIRAA